MYFGKGQTLNLSHPLKSQCFLKIMDFLVAQRVKNMPEMQETWCSVLGWGGVPGGQQSVQLQRERYN